MVNGDCTDKNKTKQAEFVSVINTEMFILELKLKLVYVNQRKQFQSSQQLKRQMPTNTFSQMVTRVQNSHLFKEILIKQQEKFDLLPYKIENTEIDNILKIYNNITMKYQITKELSEDSINWNQNQRRLFVWFIICYSYFQQENNEQISEGTWDQLSDVFFGKRPDFLQFQYLNLLKIKGRISWSPQEDTLLTECIQNEEAGKWNEVSKRLFFNSQKKIFKSPKHCRQRWLNHLDSKIKHGDWSNEQDKLILAYVQQSGKRWSKIVPLLNQSRTQHMIKNRYNSIISKSKGSKKLKEEEIIIKVIKQLNKSLNNQVPSKKQIKTMNSIKTSFSEQKDDLQIEQVSILNPQTDGNSQVSHNLTIASPQPYNYVLDYNSFLLLNQLYYPQNIIMPGYITEEMNTRLLPSKQSNFTRYAQQNLA